MGPSTAKPSILVFSRSNNQPALMEPLHHGLSATKDIDYHLLTNPEAVYVLSGESGRDVLLVNCLLKEDIADLYNLLPQFAARVAEGTLRILVINSIGHPRLGSLLRSRAQIEVIECPTTIKAVQYKLKQALSLVHQAFQKAAEARAHAETPEEVDGKLGTKTRAARAKEKSSGQSVLWQSAVEFARDYWWIPSRKNIRNVVGVWLIDMLGPGPVIGTWEEMPGIEQAGEKAWIWRPRSIAEELFQTPEGRWIFFGKQPEFAWQKNLWSFVSKNPMLAFYPEGEQAPSFVRIEFRPDEGLLFLENSKYTQGILQRIQATFESRLGARTAAPEEPTKDEVGGNFDGWDFKVDAPSGSSTRSDPGGGGEGDVDWKDHTGSQGVNFRPADVRVDTRKPAAKFRNALTPDETRGGDMGLLPVEQAGITSGGEAFDRMKVHVEILRKNGALVQDPPSVLLYEVNESGSTLLVRDPSAKLGDLFVLRFGLDSGDSKMECSMDWELMSVDLKLEDGVLVTGTFRGGDFDPLFLLLDRLDARKKELKDFYSTARG